jgi:hypothetical protein
MRGQRRCRMHGGQTPNGLEAGRRRLVALVEPAIAALARLVQSADSDATRLSAARAVLDYCGFKIPEKLEQSGEMIIRVEYVDPPLPTPSKTSHNGAVAHR